MRATGARVSVAVLAASAALAGCGSEPLAQRDPEGYKACSMLAENLEATDIVSKVGGMLLVGEQANKSGIKAIRDSADVLLDADAMEALEDTDSAGQNFTTADPDKLRAACEDEGFEF